MRYLTILFFAGSIYAQGIDATNCSNGNTLQYNSTSGNFECKVVSGGAIPTGSILLINSGSCPTGFTQVSSLSGKFLLGTVVANGDIGTTGGLDNVTPAGTNGTVSFTPTGTIGAPTITWPAGVPTNATENAHTHSVTAAGTVTAPTFTGSALATHAHELPWQIPTATTIRQIAVATFGTGTSRAATAVSAAGTSNTTSAAVALVQAVSAGTPAGTNSIPTFTGSSVTSAAGSAHTHTISWPVGVPTNSTPNFTGTAGTVSAQAFTGTQFDNRPAFTKVIFCSKD